MTHRKEKYMTNKKYIQMINNNIKIMIFRTIEQDNLASLDLITMVIFETIIKTKMRVLNLFLGTLRIYLVDNKNNLIEL